MNYVKLVLSIVIIVVSTSTKSYSQDPEFTQFYANQLYLNPAFAGTSKCPRIVANYRNQWPAMKANFVTYSLAYDQYIDALGGGIGVLLVRDDAGQGILSTTRASLVYSKHLAINSNTSVNFGFEGGYHQKEFNPTGEVFGDQISSLNGVSSLQTLETLSNNPSDPGLTGDPRAQILSSRNVDFAAGALIYSKYFYAGAAGHHLTTPDEGFIGESRLPLKLTGHLGAKIPIKGRLGGKTKGSETSISPNVLFRQQSAFQQLNLGLYVKKGALVTGLWYRNSDAFIVLLGIEQDQIRLGYSYDLTVSRLAGSTTGSHELSMQWQFPCRPPRKKLRAIQCPSF